jgi:hypothetical protein
VFAPRAPAAFWLQIDDVAYPITVDALNTICSTYGFVRKMTIFEKAGNWQVGGRAPGGCCSGGCRTRLQAQLRPGARHQQQQETADTQAALRAAVQAAWRASGSLNVLTRSDRCRPQALVQYNDMQTAASAKQCLEGHCMYEGGYNKLKCSFSMHNDLVVRTNDDRNRDFTVHSAPAPMAPPSEPAAGACVLARLLLGEAARTFLA